MNKSKILLILFLSSGLTLSQWTHTTAPLYPVITLSASGNYVFEGLSGGIVFRSTNNGDSWTTLSIPGMLTENAYVSSYGSKVFAASRYGGLHLSTDYGETWSDISTGVPPGPYIEAVCVTANTILVSKGAHFPYGGGLFVTTNNGTNWLVNDYNASVINANGNNVISGIWYPGVIESSNSGLNWVNTNSSLPGLIQTLAFGSNYILAGILASGSSNGIYRSVNNGSNWQPANNGLPQTPYVTSLLSYGAYNFAGLDMDSGGVYMTSNNGDNWINTNLNSTAIYALTRNNTYIFAGSHAGDGVWRENLPGTTGISSNNNQLPDKFALYQNYPNPFNPSTKISYDLPSAVNVKLVVYDVLGREVKTLVNEKQNAGRHEIEFDAGNYPSGVYYYKLSTDNYTNTKKMVLIK